MVASIFEGVHDFAKFLSAALVAAFDPWPKMRNQCLHDAEGRPPSFTADTSTAVSLCAREATEVSASGKRIMGGSLVLASVVEIVLNAFFHDLLSSTGDDFTPHAADAADAVDAADCVCAQGGSVLAQPSKDDRQLCRECAAGSQPRRLGAAL